MQELFARALADGGDEAPATELLAGPPERIKARLAVYRGNGAGNIRQALAGAYPVCARIVGSEFFAGVAREYLHRHPSTSGDLNGYGGEFAAFVAGFEHTQDLPYLPDVARLEWLVHHAYYAQDARSFAPARLESVPREAWETLRATLAPGCAVLESRWPIVRVWQVHQEDCTDGIKVDLASGPERALVHRAGFRVRVSALSTGEFRFLQRAGRGDSIAAALSCALAGEPELDFPVRLSQWVATGVIIDFVPGREGAA